MATKALCAALLIFAAAGTASAIDKLPEFQSPLRPAAPGADGAWLALDWDQQSYEALRHAGQLSIRNFPLGVGRQLALELEQFSILAPDARVVAVGAQGEEELPPADLVLLRGTVSEWPGSQVFIGLSPLGTNGFIRNGEEMWIIATPPPHENAPTVIYNSAHIPEGVINLLPLRCGNDELPFGGAADPLAALKRAVGVEELPDSSPIDNNCRVVRVAIESDWEYNSLVFFGQTQAAANYAQVLLAAVSEIYRGEIDVGLQVTYVRIWTDNSDPYSALTVNARLVEFRNYWNANEGSVVRHIAHILTGLRNGSSGVAYLGVICTPPLAYGASGYLNGSFPYPLVNNSWQNWDLTLVAHEIGHNFNAPHTHETSPLIDGCGLGNCANAHLGTIMSYCQQCPGGVSNIRLAMHHRIINEYIMPYLNSVTCPILNTPAAISQHPQSQGFISGRDVQLSVIASGTPPFTYRWRRNGVIINNGGRISGATTNTLTIAQAQQADSGQYTAEVSNVCSTQISNTAVLSVIPVCYANCDVSTTPPILNIFDFLCFMDQFAYALGLPHEQQIVNYANCDLSTSAPVLNMDDFMCFITKFNAGCN